MRGSVAGELDKPGGEVSAAGNRKGNQVRPPSMVPASCWRVRSSAQPAAASTILSAAGGAPPGKQCGAPVRNLSRAWQHRLACGRNEPGPRVGGRQGQAPAKCGSQAKALIQLPVSAAIGGEIPEHLLARSPICQHGKAPCTAVSSEDGGIEPPACAELPAGRRQLLGRPAAPAVLRAHEERMIGPAHSPAVDLIDKDHWFTGRQGAPPQVRPPSVVAKSVPRLKLLLVRRVTVSQPCWSSTKVSAYPAASAAGSPGRNSSTAVACQLCPPSAVLARVTAVRSAPSTSTLQPWLGSRNSAVPTIWPGERGGVITRQ